MEKIRIMLVDDHTLVREGLRVLLDLQDDMEVVGEAANGKDAVALYNKIKPDILLLDLVLPDFCGVDVIKKIRVECADPSILVLTTFDGEEDIYRALKSGAKGYLLKDMPKAELFEAIRNVWAGNHYIPGDIASKLAAYVSETSLTNREQEILLLIEAGLSNKKIAEHLYITEGTVKTHVNHILKKFSVQSRMEAVKHAQDRGLLRMSR